MKNLILLLSLTMLSLSLTGCFSAKSASMAGKGGEVVGVGGRPFTEPTPYGMVRVDRGYLKMGDLKSDSLWGKTVPVKDISVDGFGWTNRDNKFPVQTIRQLGSRLHTSHPSRRPKLWR